MEELQLVLAADWPCYNALSWLIRDECSELDPWLEIDEKTPKDRVIWLFAEDHKFLGEWNPGGVGDGLGYWSAIPFGNKLFTNNVERIAGRSKMRFVIAPDWVMKMKDDELLCTKQVLDIYDYSLESRGINILVKKGHLPHPDKPRQQGRRRLLFWSVRHIKNNVKLPSEIVEL